MRTRALAVALVLAGCTAAGPSASPSPTSSRESPEPSRAATPSPTPIEAPGPLVEGPEAILYAAADGLRLRQEPFVSAELVGTLPAGQLMGVIGGPASAEGMEWYEVRIGPGDVHGWVAAGPEGDWLRRLENGSLTFACECFEDDDPATRGLVQGLVAADPRDAWAVTPVTFGVVAQAWSPDGSSVAVSHGVMDTTTIEVVDASGTGRELGWGFDRSWSPDGDRLAWIRGLGIGGSPDDARLVLVDVGDWSMTEVALPGLRPATQLSWSPDGSRLALAGFNCPECPPDQPLMGDPPSAIFTLDIDGTGLRQLTRGPQDGAPFWSPDGSRVFFLRFDLSGTVGNQWYTVPADGGDATPLFEGVAPNWVRWSPDGTRMAFGMADGLAVAEGNGRNAVTIVSTDGPVNEVVWSPDGRSIAYTVIEPQQFADAVWVVASDGSSDAIRVSPPETYGGNLDWQPILVPLQ